MLHVVIDTSIYRQDPRREKSAFRALTRLCQGKKVKLHVPEFVRREFVSQQKELMEKDILAAQKAAEAMIRKAVDGDLVDHGEEILAQAGESLKKAGAWAIDTFQSWVKKCDGVEHEITLKHTQQMTEDYFVGAPPFTKVKEREDMPDSLIFQVVQDLAAAHEKLYVVVNDGALFKAAQSLKNVSAFATLDSFIDSPECQNALQELASDVVKQNIARAKQLLSKMETDLQAILQSDLESALVGETVKSREIPDDNNEGTIFVVGSAEDVTFDFSAMEYYGASEIGIPFEASVECELNYAVFKSDYWTLDDYKQNRISIGDRNDHYYDADEWYTLSVKGVLSVEFQADKVNNPDITDEEIEEALQFGDHKVEIKELSIPGDDDV